MNTIVRLASFLLAIIVVSACAAPTATSQATPTNTPRLTSTHTPMPTATPRPTKTLAPQVYPTCIAEAPTRPWFIEQECLNCRYRQWLLVEWQGPILISGQEYVIQVYQDGQHKRSWHTGEVSPFYEAYRIPRDTPGDSIPAGTVQIRIVIECRNRTGLITGKVLGPFARYTP